jgi:hypothetical protein
MDEKIIVKGARTHNLKNVTVDPAPDFGLVERNSYPVCISNSREFCDFDSSGASQRKKAKVGSSAGNIVTYGR